jgi:transposase
MDIVHRCCAGLDVHKDTVVACVRRLPGRGPAHTEVRTFATTTRDLLALADWLVAQGVTVAAMESTGVYWKPVFNLLEPGVAVVLVNAEHVRKVPGRKTDVKDAEWLAELLQHGLLRPSFVPPAPIRQLRDLTRQRSRLAGEKASVANRIQKVLEDANIKLASVASDVLGASGRDILRDLIAGVTSPGQLANRARGRMRDKLPQLRLALEGRVTDHHRFLLQLHLDHLAHLEALLERLGAEIDRLLAAYREAEARLRTIPGISQHTAAVVLAEIGADMGQFPSADQLTSWAGMCPGNDESAGKRRRTRTPSGDRWLKQALVQAAWAASHTKGTYLAASYRRLARRRGKKRALIALGRALLVIAYHVLKRGTTYQEPDAGYLDRQRSERLTRDLVKRLQSLGHTVTLEPKLPAASEEPSNEHRLSDP